MKPIRILLTVCLISIVTMGCLMVLGDGIAQADDNFDTDIRFMWSFGAVVGPGDKRELITIKKEATLKAGDQFKMMLELKSKCFVYLIYYGSKGEIQMLFPFDTNHIEVEAQVGKKYYIPAGDLWFTLDENTGVETFYLLATRTRLNELESLIKHYVSVDQEKKSKVTEQILSEIKNVRWKHKTFTAAVERPIKIGGRVRGGKDRHDVAALAVEVSAADFYSKIFRIENK